MSSTLETRLAEALSALPAPSSLAGERALAAALEALPGTPRRSWRGPSLAVAAGLVALLAAGAGALAAIGTFHVASRPKHEAPVRLALPAGASAIAVVAGGKLWLTSRRGTRIEALPVSAAGLSPHGLYVAVGSGRSLVAMSPAGRRAWSQPTAGPVEEIAWAPNGLRIAYVVRTGDGLELRTIEGDGDHDRLVAEHVRRVRPSWRADSLALAYVGAGGRPLVYDLAHRSRRVAGGGCTATGGVRSLAFAPTGRDLAYAGATTVGVEGAGGCVRYESVLELTGVAWTGSGSFVTSERATVDAPSAVRTFRLRGGRVVPVGIAAGGQPWLGVDAAPGGLAVAGARDVVLVDRPRAGDRTLRVRGTLLRVGAAGSAAVDVR